MWNMTFSEKWLWRLLSYEMKHHAVFCTYTNISRMCYLIFNEQEPKNYISQLSNSFDIQYYKTHITHFTQHQHAVQSVWWLCNSSQQEYGWEKIYPSYREPSKNDVWKCNIHSKYVHKAYKHAAKLRSKSVSRNFINLRPRGSRKKVYQHCMNQCN